MRVEWDREGWGPLGSSGNSLLGDHSGTALGACNPSGKNTAAGAGSNSGEDTDVGTSGTGTGMGGDGLDGMGAQEGLRLGDVGTRRLGLGHVGTRGLELGAEG